MLGRQNERNFSYDRLALTPIFGLCFILVFKFFFFILVLVLLFISNNFVSILHISVDGKQETGCNLNHMEIKDLVHS